MSTEVMEHILDPPNNAASTLISEAYMHVWKQITYSETYNSGRRMIGGGNKTTPATFSLSMETIDTGDMAAI